MELLIGAIVSGIVQYIKKITGSNTTATLMVVAIMSLIAGAVYYYLVGTGYWEIFLKILVSAGAIYAFVVKRFE